MSGDALQAHLEGGTTTVCHLWRLERRDGVVLGFTDHDRDLICEGVTFRAGAGLGASALQQATGMAVDNTEAVGALSDAAITEEELSAGRYDRAGIRIWLANWADLAQRREIFRGTLGEVSRRGAAFRSELRGLAEPLNQQVGLVYARNCSAVLGDGRCRFDLDQPGYRLERAAETVDAERRRFDFADLAGFDDGWFSGGRLEVISGAAAGLSAMIRSDRVIGGRRRIELWQGVRAGLVAGDMLRLTAGCDKLPGTCREKFGNFLNFRGFPHLPGEDWLTAYPRSGSTGTTASGSLLSRWGQ